MAAAAGGLMGGGGSDTAGAQAASDVLGSALSAHMANRESNQSWQRQKAIFKSRYTWMVGDLKRAGLNPLLAFGGSPGGGSAPQTSGVSAKPSDYAASAREGQELGLRRAIVDEQLNNIKADTASKHASAALLAQQSRTAKAVADKEEVTKVPYDFVAKGFQALREGEGISWLRNIINSGKSAGKAVDDYLGDEGRQDRIDSMKRRGDASTYGPRDTHRGSYEDY